MISRAAELAEGRPTRVDRALARGHQRPQRFPLAAGARLGGPALGEDAPRRSDGVERVVLASRATLPPQPPDLEHPLALAAQEAAEAGAERTRSFDRE